MTEGSGPKRRPSIYDVAHRAGVSHMTVSRVLNGSPNIRDATRQRVQTAIDELEFTRSSIARALATKRTMRIGVLVDAPVQYGPNSMVRALESAARVVGYSVTAFTVSDSDGARIGDGLSNLLAQGIDGICLIAPRASSLETLERKPMAVPTVVVKSQPDDNWHTVAIDQYAGAKKVVRYLVDQGHTRILHFGGPRDWFDACERARAWRDVLAEAGLEAPDVTVGDWTAQSGYEFGKTVELADSTAVFAANDQMALGLIHALRERGLDVPGSVSVAGFDDAPDSAHYWPPLTTVRQDFNHLGQVVLRELVGAIDGQEDGANEVIEPELVVRESVSRVDR